MNPEPIGLFRGLRWLVGFASIAAAALALLITLDEPTAPKVVATTEAPMNGAAAGVPALSYYKARDGARLAYRAYPGGGNGVAILLHGSSGTSLSMHALARALADSGVAAFAPDVRGHGDSGVAGDIGYFGQLDDDLEDLVNYVRGTYRSSPIVLIGHANGAGFALRVAGSSLGSRFSGCLLVAPDLDGDAAGRGPRDEPIAGKAALRIAGLTLLRRLGIDWFEQLPVIAFTVRPELRSRLGATYSYRLYANFRADEDFLGDFHRAKVPIVLVAGAEDGSLFTDRYRHALAAVGVPVRTVLVPRVDRDGMLIDPAALATIAQEYRKLLGDAGGTPK